MGNLAMSVIGMGINFAIAYFFPQKVKGPRQDNLKAQTSKYGDPLSRAYGTVRLGGAAVWLKNNKVDEHKKKKRTKAMGPIQITYTYTADFAIAFTWNGPISGITRVWADKKLVYDTGTDGLQIAIGGGKKKKGIAKGSSIKVYLGTDTQAPDPNIEADRGVGMVPAWPGLCYVVITNFPLDEFGIRVPNIEAEIVCAGVTDTISVNPTDDGAERYDMVGSRYVTSTQVSGNNRLLTMNNIADGAVMWTAPVVAELFYSLHMTAKNDIIVSDAANDIIYIFDGMTGAKLQEVAIGTQGDPNAPFQNMTDITIGGTNWLFLTHFNRISAFSSSGDGYILRWNVSLGGNTAAIAASPDRLYFIDELSDFIFSVPWNPLGIGTTDSGPGAITEPHALHYNEDSDSLIVLDGVSDTIYVLDAEMNILRSKVSVVNIPVNASEFTSKRMMSGDDSFIVKGTNNDIAQYKLSDLSLIQHVIASTSNWENKGSSFSSYGVNADWEMVAVVAGSGVSRWWFMPTLSRAAVPLADVITAECGYVDLAVDVTAIVKTIKGYSVREPTAPRGVLEDLMRTQFFDFSQQSGVIKFVNRSPTATKTINIDDMGVSDDDDPENPKLIEEEYADLRELPARISISYPAFGADYRTGTQSIQKPDDLDDTKNDVNFSTPLVMTDDEAAQSIDILYNETRESLSTYKTKVSSIYLDLAPADVCNLPLDESTTVTAVLSKVEGDTILDSEFRLRTIPYTSDAVGSVTPGDDHGSLLGIADVEFLPIDGHLLRAADNNDNFYYGVTRKDDGEFKSATVFRSTDGGSSYNPWEGVADELPRGFATTVLPDRPHPESWDYATDFIVAFGSIFTVPTSVTEAALLADGTLNAFAVKSGTDWEYIRAATIVNNGNGTWTLSDLLRGRKGTDFAMASHAIGDTVIYLDPDVVDRSETGDKDLSRIYAPVATSTAFTTKNARLFTNTARGLRPWSPVSLAAARDGSSNITFTWLRRDRLGQEWPEDGPEDPPMSETTESYKVKIYQGATLKRTIPSSTETAPYSAADQTTDFGSPQASVLTGILQVSSTYGDGIERQSTV